MKKVNIIALSLVFVLTLIIVTNVSAVGPIFDSVDKGPVIGHTIAPVVPPDPGTSNLTGRRNAALPFTGDEIPNELILDPANAPDASPQDIFWYMTVGDSPTQVCFPAPGCATTRVYFENPNTGQWVMPGLATTSETYKGVVYRCAEAIANGNYGLVGK